MKKLKAKLKIVGHMLIVVSCRSRWFLSNFLLCAKRNVSMATEKPFRGGVWTIILCLRKVKKLFETYLLETPQVGF